MPPLNLISYASSRPRALVAGLCAIALAPPALAGEAASPTALPGLTVTHPQEKPVTPGDVFRHPGARDLTLRGDFLRSGATQAREALNRIPGVNAPDNNGTGSHDLALNVGVRGLNPRLASRSTVLVDGIPVPFAPYGQPQLSLAPLSLGNMAAIDVIRGAGAVRYGPQNVGGIINFITRAIPDAPSASVSIQGVTAPGSPYDGSKRTANALIGGTHASGLGAALLYAGTRGMGYRAHSDTRIDDLMLKLQYQPDDTHRFHAMGQYYDGQAQMPGGLSQADYAADPFQSTRPHDRFWGQRTLLAGGYVYSGESLRVSADAFFTKTLRSGYLDQRNFVSLSPRYYWVRGLEARATRDWQWGQVAHEISAGYRYINEASHELRYRSPPGAPLPGTDSRRDRNTRGQTVAHAFYVDDRIDIGRWSLTPGLRYESIDQSQRNLITERPYRARYNVPLPAFHALYRLDPDWHLYANTETSFGSVQYSQMPNRVAAGQVKPEKARTWEAGIRHQSEHLQASLGTFLVNFDNQYESNQATDSVIARGRTRQRGIEAEVAYALSHWSPMLEGLALRANYALVDARIRESGGNQGNTVPFVSRHKGLAALGYTRGPLQLDLELQAQSSQFADNANTRIESADGSNGRIPGYALWNLSAHYDLAAAGLAGARIGLGVQNLLDRRYFTRAYGDNNRGKYLGLPRTPWLQLSFDL